ncbi:hypothetical protein EZL74_08200 [Flavobacterium silvisoli]|uniref:Uncharacterized protein n=1 Tax=Flavobacterium silvisoli TaxID=2529433 RepID=A0A4Q9YY20_9FLAO|nr:hypothetical protein [Flavobacterium silvisoli]TBX68765.1 hypothetical protein EZL74_08200 [Flavobacterium silvisoli]
MNSTKPIHTFHIPVMGLAYTIDSPIRVAQYGISSVISIIDDEIIEKMHQFYSKKFHFNYEGISNKIHDYRAKRITAYLNMVDDVVKQKFDAFKSELAESKEALEHYLTILPNKSEIKQSLQNLLAEGKTAKETLKNYLETHLSPGSIDVNIMTKVDKDNFIKNEQLPTIFNDAHASLRGFANSKLTSSVVLSAGMNPRLYSYFESFEDFFPDANGILKKKIILKVSDFRSAMIQGNFLAKKGLWVSEYRIESGLNCGGHAFATEGFLLGPILEEFKQKKEQLVHTAHDLMVKTLIQKGIQAPDKPYDLKITVQGGVGTAEEHSFLMEHYQIDAVGWGSPFLLVPEATSVDDETRALLANAKENDFYTSQISPLGVPFNTVRGTTNEVLKTARIANHKFGSSCPKKLLALSKEFSEQGTCTASKKYQEIKLGELETQKRELSEAEFDKRKTKITEKACLCVGLVNSAYLENGIKIKGEEQGVVICPGPNLAYFDRVVSLSDMVQHIYGNKSVLSQNNRPNLFLNELKMYVDYLKKEISEITNESSSAQLKKLQSFKSNLLEGIGYYQHLFAQILFFKTDIDTIQHQLEKQLQNVLTIAIPQPEMA